MKLDQIFPGAGRTIAYIPELAQMMGNDVDGALLLCQLLFWEGKQAKRNNGWIRKSQSEILQETGLTRSRQESARRRLKDLNFISETNTGKSPPVIGFEVNLDNIRASWIRFQENPNAFKAQIKETKARLSKRVPPHNIPDKSAKHSARNGPDNKSQRSTMNCSNVPSQSARSPQNLYTGDDYRDDNKRKEAHRRSSPSPSEELDDNKELVLLSSSTSGLTDGAETSRFDTKKDATIANWYEDHMEIDDEDPDDDGLDDDGLDDEESRYWDKMTCSWKRRT